MEPEMVLKFVLLRDGTLYLGDALNNYHQNIANNAPRSAVRAAGWLNVDPETGSAVCYNNSIGYRIGFNDADEELICKTLEKNTSALQAVSGQYFVLKMETFH